MNIAKYETPKADHAFIGTWHIYEMDMWGENYFNSRFKVKRAS